MATKPLKEIAALMQVYRSNNPEQLKRYGFPNIRSADILTYNPNELYTPWALAVALTQGNYYSTVLYQDRYIHTETQIENLIGFIHALQYTNANKGLVKVGITTNKKSYDNLVEYLKRRFPEKGFGLKGGIFAFNTIPLIVIMKVPNGLPAERQLLFLSDISPRLSIEIAKNSSNGGVNQRFQDTCFGLETYYCYPIVWKIGRSWDFVLGDKIVQPNTYTRVAWEDQLPYSTKILFEVPSLLI